MNRFRLFTLGFILTSVIYLLLSPVIDVIDTVVLGVFFLSSLAYVFALEELPSDVDALQEPSVHYYRKSRLNLYGYSMAALLVVISLLFFIITQLTTLRTGIVAIILWFIMIVVTYLVTRYTQTDLYYNIITDYIKENYFRDSKEVDEQKIKFLVKTTENILKSNNKINKDDLNKRAAKKVKELKMDELTIRKVVDEYLRYTSTLLPVISDEISEINRVSK